MFDRMGRRKYLNGPERQACLEAFNRDTDKARRAFALTLFHTGCRISEARKLTVRGVDFSQKCIVFETLKRRKRGVFRAVPVPDNLIVLLREILAGSPPSAPVWHLSRLAAYRLIKRHMKQMGVKGVMASPKGLRHGFAIACIAQSIPLTTVQKWLGHARLETTAIYLSVCGDEERDLARRLWAHLRLYQKSGSAFKIQPATGVDIALDDDQWQRVAPCLSKQGKMGRPRTDDRKNLNAILHVLVTGCRWNDLPPEYGDSMTVWRRLKLWAEDGSLIKAWRHLLNAPVSVETTGNTGESTCQDGNPLYPFQSETK